MRAECLIGLSEFSSGWDCPGISQSDGCPGGGRREIKYHNTSLCLSMPQKKVTLRVQRHAPLLVTSGQQTHLLAICLYTVNSRRRRSELQVNASMLPICVLSGATVETIRPSTPQGEYEACVAGG